MTDGQVAQLLLDLAIFFAFTYLLAGVLERRRIPGILAALFVAMAVRYAPLGDRLLSPEFHVPLSFLADLGVLFLLFFIGLQIDLKGMRDQSGDIIWLTVLNTTVPLLMGMAVMLMLGYGWLLAFIIGLTRMPTAEAVIVPILDEFRLIRTRVDRLVTALLPHVAVEAVAIRAGLPEETITAYGEEYPMDPIVLGRRQRSMVERIHVGSTTSAVISLASCPVLVVPLHFSEDIS